MKLINLPTELRNGVKKQGINGAPNESNVTLGLTPIVLEFNDELDILSISVGNGEKFEKFMNPINIKIEEGKLKVEIEKKEALGEAKEPPLNINPPIDSNPPVNQPMSFIDGADGRPFTNPDPIKEPQPNSYPIKEPVIPVNPSISFIDGADGRPFTNPDPIKESQPDPSSFKEPLKTNFLKISDIDDSLKQGMKKIGTDGAPSEIFSIIESNLLRIRYNDFTEEIIEVEKNGELFDNPTSIKLVDGEIIIENKAEEELNNQHNL